MRAFVYVAAVTPGLSLAVCSYAPGAATRSSFAAAAIGGRFTVTAAALRGRGNERCRRLAGGIKRASVAVGGTPPE
jgi:hypothetical protein